MSGDEAASFTPLVLVHGGGFAASCWDLLLDHVDGPALAVDLPGRGAHPAPVDSLTLAGSAASVADDVDRAGFDDVVLVGHSLAGCSLPAMIGLLGDRVRHAVFVACTVPDDGTSCVDTLPADVRDLVRAGHGAGPGPQVLDDATARAFFGNDLDEAQFAWCRERMVPEGTTVLLEPVDLSPLRRPLPRTWVRPRRDAIVEPEKQLRFAANVGHCDLVDLDAGHMCMISRPADLAAVLNRIARTSGRRP